MLKQMTILTLHWLGVVQARVVRKDGSTFDLTNSNVDDAKVIAALRKAGRKTEDYQAVSLQAGLEVYQF